MTDAWLMDADCVHGVAWYDCRKCPQGPCPLCAEPVSPGDDISPTGLYVEGQRHIVHRSCMLREVVGGIGHLIAHEFWCLQHHDPDAGLTRRQSALLVDVYCAAVGIEPCSPTEQTFD